MKTLATAAAIASLAALALACGGPAHPKLEEIEVTDNDSDGLYVYSATLDYSDDKLTTITYSEDGTDTGRLELDYSGDKLDAGTYTDHVSSRTTLLSVDYDGDNVASYSITKKRADGTTSEVILYEFEYDSDDRIEKRTWTDTETYDGSSSTYTAYEELEYDSDGRLERTTYHGESWTGITDLDYDDDGLLDDIIVSEDGGSTAYGFSYNDDNRLKSVTPQGSSSYSLAYNDDNRIESVERTYSGGGRHTARYTYGDGDIKQLIPTPDAKWGDLFDMGGERIEKPQGIVDLWNSLVD